jgi:hypothetical protein
VPRINLTAAAKQALFSRESGDVLLTLMSIDHDLLPDPIRVVANTENVTSQGRLFIAYPFQIVLPVEEPNTAPVGKLILDNVDRTILSAIGELNSPPTVSIEMVLASSTDIIEVGPIDFRWYSTQWTPVTISADLTFEDVLNQRFPGDMFSPADFPGLF